MKAGSFVNARAGSALGMIVMLVSSPSLSAQNITRPNPATTHVVYSLPGMDSAVVRKNIIYVSRGSGALAFDHYSPKGLKPTDKLPAIIFVSGGEDTKDWAWFQDYGRLAAASGFIGVTFNKRYPRGLDGLETGFSDTQALIRHLRDNVKSLNIDENKICLWTFSAGGRLSSVAMQDDYSYIRCVVIFYGVLDVAAEWENLPVETRAKLAPQYAPLERLNILGKNAPPLFVARAVRDSTLINSGIERFVSEAQNQNVELLLVNYPDGDHGFDGYNDTETSRWVIKQALGFIKAKTK